MLNIPNILANVKPVPFPCKPLSSIYALIGRDIVTDGSRTV